MLLTLILFIFINYVIIMDEKDNIDNNNDTYWKKKNFTSIDLRKLAVSKVIIENKSIEKAAQECKICSKSLKKYLKSFITKDTVLTNEEINKLNNPNYKRPHKRTKIDPTCGALIYGLIEHHQPTLDELVIELQDLGYFVSRSCINKYIIDNNLTYKVVQKVT